ncbi:MAG: hypothetical protein E7205_14370 [Tissierellaceae bacterium]|nr:hypothetical protein [Tissierellaceae bacterium]
MAGPTAIFSYLFVQLFVVNFISFTYLAFMDVLLTSIIPTLISIVVFYIIIPQKSLETAIIFSSVVAIYNLLDGGQIRYISALRNDSSVSKILSILICLGFIIWIGVKKDKVERRDKVEG